MFVALTSNPSYDLIIYTCSVGGRLRAINCLFTLSRASALPHITDKIELTLRA